jgi:hypothetical protein
VDLIPGARIRWRLGYMLNLDPGPNGRSAGTGLIMTQILPFADPSVPALDGRCERAIYEALRPARGQTEAGSVSPSGGAATSKALTTPESIAK